MNDDWVLTSCDESFSFVYVEKQNGALLWASENNENNIMAARGCPTKGEAMFFLNQWTRFKHVKYGVALRSELLK